MPDEKSKRKSGGLKNEWAKKLDEKIHKRKRRRTKKSEMKKRGYKFNVIRKLARTCRCRYEIAHVRKDAETKYT